MKTQTSSEIVLIIQSFILALRETLDGTNMQYTISEKIQFEATKDNAYITAGRQAERYMIRKYANPHQ